MSQGRYTMTGRKAAALVATLAVAAGISAPAASARDTCRSPSIKGVCQTDGIVSRKAGLATTPPPNNEASVFPWLMAQGGL